MAWLVEGTTTGGYNDWTRSLPIDTYQMQTTMDRKRIVNNKRNECILKRNNLEFRKFKVDNSVSKLNTNNKYY